MIRVSIFSGASILGAVIAFGHTPSPAPDRKDLAEALQLQTDAIEHQLNAEIAYLYDEMVIEVPDSWKQPPLSTYLAMENPFPILPEAAALMARESN